MNPIELFALLADMATFACVVEAGNFSVSAGRRFVARPDSIGQIGARLIRLANRFIPLCPPNQHTVSQVQSKST